MSTDVTTEPHTGPTPTTSAIPLHLRGSSIGLVVVGGAIGTLARYLLSAAIPAVDGIPLGIFVINVVGAFLLGMLLAALSRSGPDHGWRRSVRLGVGTGVMGGFTTYSTFAVGADGLFTGSHVGLGIAYAVATVIVGAAASFAGIALGSRVKGAE